MDGVRNKFVYTFDPMYRLTFRQQNRLQAATLVGVDRYLISVTRAP